MSRLDNLTENKKSDGKNMKLKGSNDDEVVKANETDAGTKAQIDAKKATADSTLEAQMKTDEMGLPKYQEEKTAEPESRTYVLRNGKTATFPIRYPNGQILPVKFSNGSKTLSGRLMRIFHEEYVNNPIMRTKISEVKQDVADKIAEQYVRSQNRIAKPGFDSAGGGLSKEEARVNDAQIRRMQAMAAASEGALELPGPVTRLEDEVNETPNARL